MAFRFEGFSTARAPLPCKGKRYFLKKALLRISQLKGEIPWRRRADSNRRMRALQAPALPLGYVANGVSVAVGRGGVNAASAAPLSAAPSRAGQLANAKTQSLWAMQSMPKVPWQIALPGVFLYELQERTLDFRRSCHDVTAEKNVFAAIEVCNHTTGLSYQ